MKKRSVEFRGPFRAEFLDTVQWYFERSPRAAARSIGVAKRAIAEVSESPDRHRAYLRGTRRILLRPFPYRIVYRYADDIVQFLAFAHAGRGPDYWADRLGPLPSGGD